MSPFQMIKWLMMALIALVGLRIILGQMSIFMKSKSSKTDFETDLDSIAAFGYMWLAWEVTLLDSDQSVMEIFL